jgi:hypothetical protein
LLYILAFADVQKIRRFDIDREESGGFIPERVKTETSTCSAFTSSDEDMDAHKDHPHCANQGKLLPVPSNAKMNEYLKEISEPR